MAAKFRSQGHPNPTRDKDGILDWNLARQYQAYKSMDPKEVQEKAIPLKVISLIEQVRGTEIQQATGQLIIGAFFFACRSCEYLKVQKPEDKKTKQLTLENIAFYKNNKRITNSSEHLDTADRVALRHRKTDKNSTPSRNGKQVTPSFAQFYNGQQ